MTFMLQKLIVYEFTLRACEHQICLAQSARIKVVHTSFIFYIRLIQTGSQPCVLGEDTMLGTV